MNLPVLAYLNLASNLLPMGTGLARRKHLRNVSALFFGFTVVGFMVEIVTLYLAWNRVPNLWILQFYTLFEFVVLTHIFAQWNANKRIRAFYWFLILLYVIIWVYIELAIGNLQGTRQYTESINGILFVLMATFSLVELVGNENRFYALHKSFRFWISTGVLLYFAGNMMLFGMGEFISSLRFQDATAVWSIHWGLNVGVNSCYMIGFLCLPTTE